MVTRRTEKSLLVGTPISYKSKLVLAIINSYGNTEVVVCDNAEEKLKDINNRYDDYLRLKTDTGTKIIDYMIV